MCMLVYVCVYVKHVCEHACVCTHVHTHASGWVVVVLGVVCKCLNVCLAGDGMAWQVSCSGQCEGVKV